MSPNIKVMSSAKRWMLRWTILMDLIKNYDTNGLPNGIQLSSHEIQFATGSTKGEQSGRAWSWHEWGSICSMESGTVTNGSRSLSCQTGLPYRHCL